MPIIQEPDSIYHSRMDVSNSMLGTLSPPFRFWSQYLANVKTPRKETDAMNEGSAMHMLLLEPSEFDTRFVLAPDINRRTKAGKEEWEQFVLGNAGKTVLKPEQFDKASEMANAVFNHGAAAELLREPGVNEATITFPYKDTPIPCRGRIDKLLPRRQVLLDIKSSRDASPHGFQRAVATYRYHRQAMWYRDGLAACGDDRFVGARDWPFIWIVVESTAPYCVGVYTLDERQVEEGRKEYEKHMETLQGCLSTNIWPHYTENVEILHLPNWAYNDFDATEVIA